MYRIAHLVNAALRKVRRHGVCGVLYVGLLYALGYGRWFKLLRLHYIEQVNPAFVDVPAPYAATFFTKGALAEFARDPRGGFSEPFLHYALAKGDKCYGFTHDGALSAYGWYATTPTRVSPELTLHFGRDYIYMYKGFTHERHRGKRLYPIGMTRALRHYRAVGYTGMLNYVEATNLDSLKACARAGFQVFGSIWVVKLLGRYFTYSTPGCARFGFRIGAVSAGRRDAFAAGVLSRK